MSKPAAWYQYPEPDGRDYSLSELHDAAIVEELFDYCAILLAVIFASGWRELFCVHGVRGLLAINRRSGWFDEDDDVEALAGMVYWAHLSGYDPETDTFGEYDDATGQFHAKGSADR